MATRKLSLLLLLLSAVFAGFGGMLPHAALASTQVPSLTVLCDPSLNVPLNLIARRFSVERNMAVTTVFGATKQQINDIQQGAEANVIITAKSLWMDRLQQKGLIDVYSRRNVARNRLVLAVPTRSSTPLPSLRSEEVAAFFSNAPEAIVALGDPAHTAEGSYAMEALGKTHLDMVLEPHYSFFPSIFRVISMVQRYDSAAILFRTDTLLFPGITERAAFEPEVHRPIVYQGAVIAGDNMDQAREFLSYLGSSSAHDILKAYGFDPSI